MNQTSSVVTGGVTFSVAAVSPVIAWAINGFPHPVPDTVPYLIAAGIVTAGHLLVNLGNAWLVSRKPAGEPKP
jgi:hypothetical protein